MLAELPRMVAIRRFLLAIGLASLLGANAASAGTLVEFPNLPGQTPEDLNGYLARPDTGLAAELGSPSNGGGPFPAVLVLHDCIGITGIELSPNFGDGLKIRRRLEARQKCR